MRCTLVSKDIKPLVMPMNVPSTLRNEMIEGNWPIHVFSWASFRHSCLPHIGML